MEKILGILDLRASWYGNYVRRKDEARNSAQGTSLTGLCQLMVQ
jgi:hypothetical protein